MSKNTKQRENKFAKFLHNFLYFLHKHSKAALDSQTMSMLTARAWTESVYEYGVRLEPRFFDSRYDIITEWYTGSWTVVLEWNLR